MSGVQSIERAFALLRALATGPSGVTDLADRVELPKSTVSRLLSALEAEGAVRQVDGGTEYEIGAVLADIGGASAPDASVGAMLQPFLVDLAERTKGSAGFTIRKGGHAVWIDNVDADGQVVHVSDLTGKTFALHEVPSGVAVLSALDDTEVDEYLASVLRADRERADLVRDQIAAARDRGLVVSVGEHIPDVTTYAAPLVDSSGVIGGLYVQGPSFRFPEAGTEHAVEALVIDVVDQVNDRIAHR